VKKKTIIKNVEFKSNLFFIQQVKNIQ